MLLLEALELLNTLICFKWSRIRLDVYGVLPNLWNWLWMSRKTLIDIKKERWKKKTPPYWLYVPPKAIGAWVCVGYSM
jgi:hypothetical protein